MSLAILPVCQTCLHFQFWSAFGPKHGITGLGYTRPMYRWIMDPRVSAEPLKGNRSGAGRRWDGMMSGMLEPCYKALDRTLRLLVSLISNIFTPFQTTDLERQSPIRDISPLFLIEVSYTHQQRWLAVSSQQLLSLQLPLSRLPLPQTTQRHRRSNTAMRLKRSPTHPQPQNTVRIDLLLVSLKHQLTSTSNPSRGPARALWWCSSILIPSRISLAALGIEPSPKAVTRKHERQIEARLARLS